MAESIRCPNPGCNLVILEPNGAAAAPPERCPACAHPIGKAPAATLSLSPDGAEGPGMSAEEASRFAVPTLTLGGMPSEADRPGHVTLSLPNGGPALPSPNADPPLGGRPAVPGTPQHIGRFEIRGRLGEGAFGMVYRAYDPQLDREVALKVAKPEALGTERRVRRFLREAKAAANLRHPNIVAVFDSGQDGDHYFIASAFITGGSLAAELEKHPGGLPPRRAAAVARALAEALAYAHKRGVVHRDVKPANVLLDETGEPLLADFGLAARPEPGEERLTQEAVRGMGTPAYMAPEQADGNASAASDQYSLGCTLYELLTGQTPFGGPPELQLFLHKRQQPPSPRKANRALPRDLETVCLKCLEKGAAKRYADCHALADDLRRWQDGEVITARRVGFGERLVRWARREPRLAGAIGAALGLLVAIAVVLALAGESQRRLNSALTRAVSDLDASNIQLTAETQAKDDANAQLRAETMSKDQANRALKRTLEQVRAEQAARERQYRMALYLVDFRRAQRLRDEGKLVESIQALHTCPPDLRGWEWHYQLRLSQEDAPILDQVNYLVHDLAFSPDGSQLCVAGRELTVWDTRMRQTLRVLACPSETLGVAYSSDGGYFAAACADKNVRVWDGRTGQLLLTLEGHTKPPTSVAFHPMKDLLASAYPGEYGRGSEIVIWEPRTARKLRVLIGKSAANGLAFHPKEDLLSTGGRELTVWNPMTGEEVRQITCPIGLPNAYFVNKVCVRTVGKSTANMLSCDVRGNVLEFDMKSGRLLNVRALTGNGVTKLACPPDEEGIAAVLNWGKVVVQAGYRSEPQVAFDNGARTTDREVCALALSKGRKWLASADRQGIVRLQSLTGSFRMKAFANGTVRGVPDPRNNVHGVMFHPTEALLLSACRGGVARVCNLTTGKETLTLPGAGRCAVWSPDGRRIAGGEGTQVRVWEAQNGQEIYGQNLGQQVSCLTYNREGRWLAAGTAQGEIHLLDPARREVERRLNASSRGIRRLAFHPDGRRLAVASDEGVLRLWDVETGKPVGTLGSAAEEHVSVAFHPAGSHVAAGSRRGALTVWELESGAKVFTRNAHAEIIFDVAYSPDGSRLATASKDRKVRLWDSVTGQDTITLPDATCDVNWIAFRPDGLALAGGTDHNGSIVWDAKEEERHRWVAHHQSDVNDIAFSLDSSRFASAGQDKKVKVWDTRTGRQILTFDKHTDTVLCLAFSPDGTHVASGDGVFDGYIRIWTVNRGEQVFQLNGHPRAVYSLAFHPDGKLLLSGGGKVGEAGQIKLWDVQTGALKEEWAGAKKGFIRKVVYLGDDSRLLTGGYADRQVQLWDSRLHQVLRAFPLNASWNTHLCVTGNRSGNRLAIVEKNDHNKESEFSLWDTGRPEPLVHLLGTEDRWFHDAAFHPGGELVACAYSSAQGEKQRQYKIGVWQATDGRFLGDLPWDGPIHLIRFSPDEKLLLLAARSGNMQVRVWKEWLKDIKR